MVLVKAHAADTRGGIPANAHSPAFHRICIVSPCQRIATFGDRVARQRERCAFHRITATDVNLTVAQCMFQDCSNPGTFCLPRKAGLRFSIKPKRALIDNIKDPSRLRFCEAHAPNNFLSYRTRVCLHPTCSLPATHGIKYRMIPDAIPRSSSSSSSSYSVKNAEKKEGIDDVRDNDKEAEAEGEGEGEGEGEEDEEDEDEEDAGTLPSSSSSSSSVPGLPRRKLSFRGVPTTIPYPPPRPRWCQRHVPFGPKYAPRSEMALCADPACDRPARYANADHSRRFVWCFFHAPGLTNSMWKTLCAKPGCDVWLLATTSQLLAAAAAATAATLIKTMTQETQPPLPPLPPLPPPPDPSTSSPHSEIEKLKLRTFCTKHRRYGETHEAHCTPPMTPIRISSTDPCIADADSGKKSRIVQYLHDKPSSARRRAAIRLDLERKKQHDAYVSEMHSPPKPDSLCRAQGCVAPAEFPSTNHPNDATLRWCSEHAYNAIQVHPSFSSSSSPSLFPVSTPVPCVTDDDVCAALSLLL